MITLFCFPYAGADEKAYALLENLATAHLKIVTLVLPGRGERYHDSMPDNIHQLADDCFRQLKGKLQHPFAFFGHSMGALLSYLLVRKLKEEELLMPLHLFVSGCAAPAVVMTAERREMPEGKEWKRRLQETAGIPAVMLDNEIFWLVYEPVIRKDLTLFKQYNYQEQPPLDMPITVFTGKEDNVTADEAAAWQKETTGQVSVVSFSGKHHFWNEHAAEIMMIVKNNLQYKGNNVSPQSFSL
ncbi:MAG TPA: alpha/beta fold hydrolase [Chitinophaga sp.]|uniref:thioesterase II family protein n=1 Tax=Chitinophaga sp. TaxID=1869181 RepID=UPI002C8DDD6C|nr:alpha/beta fold hydrolase [Chitinophaga sp.]HVI47931.1 alpha/beta fold hydrolase [Chitinophaga sp.]